MRQASPTISTFSTLGVSVSCAGRLICETLQGPRASARARSFPLYLLSRRDAAAASAAAAAAALLEDDDGDDDNDDEEAS